MSSFFCEYCNREINVNSSSIKHHTCKERLLAVKNKKESIAKELSDISKKYEDGYSVTEIATEYECDRKWIEDLLKSNNVYKNIYERSLNKKYVQRKTKKIEQTCTEKYGLGIINSGQTESHKQRMKKTNGEKVNPFATDEFYILQIIKGKIVPREDKILFDEYKAKVKYYTNKSVKKMSTPDICYYSGFPIFKDKQINYNSQFYATLDHKISVLYGFIHKIDAEQIGSIENLCWCSRLVNALKCEMTEQEFITSDRYKRLNNYKQMILELIDKEVT